MTCLASYVEMRLKPRHRAERLPSTEPFSAHSPSGDGLEAILRDALRYLDPDSYGGWVAVGQRLKSLGSVGLALWLAWSARSPKFDRREAERKWATFTADRTGYPAIFAEAQRNGWNNPAKGYWSGVGILPTVLEFSRNLFPPQPASTSSAETPTIVDAAELETMPASPRLDMWGGNVPAGQTTMCFGGGGSGKSLLLQQLTTSTALGRSCLDMQTMPAVALYVTCEDDFAELHRRQHDICRVLGVSFTDKKRRLALVSLTNVIGNELAVFDNQGRMAIMPRFQWLQETIVAIGAKLIVLDNVAHFFAGNENDRHQVAAFLGLLNKLAHDTGAAIILVAHTNKSGESSGSTAWLNQVRTAVKLEIPADGNGFVPDFDARLLTRIKSNYSRTGESIAFRWHRGAFVVDADLPPNMANELARNTKAANDERVFLACLAERTRQRRAVSELVSKTYAPTVFARMTESESIGKFRLEQAMDRLFKAGAIERGFLWRDTAEGKDRHGLRETPANGAANHPPTNSANVRQPDREPPPTDPPTPPYIIDIGGAAPWGTGAPPSEEEGGPPMTS